MKRHIEPETLAYDALPNATQDQFGTNELIKSVKYGNGVTLSGLTCNLSLANGTAFITNPSVDLRKYVGSKITIDGKLVGSIKAAGTSETTSGVYASNFSSNADGWTATNGAVAGNIDSIGGEDNTLRFTVDNTNTAHYIKYTNLFVVGKKYTVSFKYYIPSGQSNIDGIYLDSAYWGVIATHNTLDAWTTVTVTFTAPLTSPRIFAKDGAVTSFQDASGDDVLYLKDITVSEYLTPSTLGVTIVSAKNGSTYNWTSDSGILPNAASFTAVITKD
ncbi:MAG: carbohydrate binding domain-containing protein [Smithella sp.]